MPESFDPIQSWLGISAKDLPPHHYRLLDISLYEADRARIDAGAARVQELLKRHSAERPKDFQRLSNLVREARACLLDSERKKAYDSKLKASLSLSAIPAAPEDSVPQPQASVVDRTSSSAPARNIPAAGKPQQPPRQSTGKAGLVIGVIVASAAVAASLWFTSQLPESGDEQNNGPIYQVAKTPEISSPGTSTGTGPGTAEGANDSGDRPGTATPTTSKTPSSPGKNEPTPAFPNGSFPAESPANPETKVPPTKSVGSAAVKSDMTDSSTPLKPEVDPLLSKLPQGPALKEGESRVLIGHRGLVRHAAIGRDGKGAITAGEDNTVRFWSIRDGKVIRILEDSLPDCRQVAMSSNGRVLVMSNPEKLVVWTPESDAKVELTPERMVPSAIAASNDGPHVYVGMQSGEVQMWLTPVRDIAERFPGLTAPVVSLALSADDGFLVAGSQDGTVAVWDTRSGKLHWRFRCTDTPYAVGLSDNGSAVAAAGFHHAIVWLVTNGSRVRAVPTGVPSREIRSVEFAHRGHTLFVSQGNVGKAWHLLSGESKTIDSAGGMLAGFPELRMWLSIPGSEAAASNKPSDYAPRIWGTKFPEEPKLVSEPDRFKWSPVPDKAWPATVPHDEALSLARLELKNELGAIADVREDQAVSQAENCLQLASEELADPPRRFELLMRACELFTRGKQLDRRAKVVTELTTAFSNLTPLLVQTRLNEFDWQASGSADQKEDLAADSISLIQRLVVANQFKAADSLVSQLPQKGVTKLDPQILPWSGSVQQLAELWLSRAEELNQLEARIQVNANDRVAHDRLGEWRAIQGRWQDALIHWEQGTREDFRKWAKFDREVGRDAEAWKVVASNWRQAAEESREPIRSSLFARARHAMSLAILVDPSAGESDLQKISGTPAILPVRIELKGSATLRWNAAELSLTTEEGGAVESLSIAGLPVVYQGPSLFVTGSSDSPLPMGLNPEGAKLLQRRGPVSLAVRATPSAWTVELPGSPQKKYLYDFILLFGKPAPPR